MVNESHAIHINDTYTKYAFTEGRSWRFSRGRNSSPIRPRMNSPREILFYEFAGACVESLPRLSVPPSHALTLALSLSFFLSFSLRRYYVQRKPLCASSRAYNLTRPIITEVWRLLMGYWSCLYSVGNLFSRATGAATANRVKTRTKVVVPGGINNIIFPRPLERETTRIFRGPRGRSKFPRKNINDRLRRAALSIVYIYFRWRGQWSELRFENRLRFGTIWFIRNGLPPDRPLMGNTLRNFRPEIRRTTKMSGSRTEGFR